MDISRRRRTFRWISSFDKVIREFRDHYREFFDDVDVGLPSDFPHRYEYRVLLEPYPDKDIGERYEEGTLSEIEEFGIDAIATYIPYHLASLWGIYIFLEKLNGLTYTISQRMGMPFDEAFVCCDRAILEHESFHFQTEYSATIIETIRRKPVYLPYFQASRPYDIDEEAIANAWMLTSRSPTIRSVRTELERLCKISPPGYRDYGKYIVGGNVNYDHVRVFWAQKFLKQSKPVFLPVKLEMPSTYVLIPTYYVYTLKARELSDVVRFISNNWRIIDVVKKLKKVLPDDVVEASATGIRLKTGQMIPIHFHPREGGAKAVRIVNQVADALGIDRRQLRESIFRSN